MAIMPPSRPQDVYKINRIQVQLRKGGESQEKERRAARTLHWPNWSASCTQITPSSAHKYSDTTKTYSLSFMNIIDIAHLNWFPDHFPMLNITDGRCIYKSCQHSSKAVGNRAQRFKHKRRSSGITWKDDHTKITHEILHSVFASTIGSINIRASSSESFFQLRGNFEYLAYTYGSLSDKGYTM